MNKETKVWLIVGLVLLGLFIFVSPDINPLALIYISNDSNLIYQYAGSPPAFKYDGNCGPSQDIRDNNIIFSNSQEISINGNNYVFTTDELTQISDRKGQSCGGYGYRVKVHKNSELIDTVERKDGYDLPECYLMDSPINVRDYGDLKATFGLDGEYRSGDVNYCGVSNYVIHKYELKPQSSTSTTNPANSTQTNPDNNVLVSPVPGKTIGSKNNYLLIGSISGIIVILAIVLLLARRK